MSKWYNKQNYYIEMPDGRTLGFYCHTTKTRSGWCQTCWCSDTDQTSKSSYYNRPWESYDYQSALLKAFDKFPKADREFLHAWDEDKVAKEHARCEAFFAAFKQAYDATPQSVKDKLAASDIELHTEGEAKAMLGMLQVASVLGDGE